MTRRTWVACSTHEKKSIRHWRHQGYRSSARSSVVIALQIDPPHRSSWHADQPRLRRASSNTPASQPSDQPTNQPPTTTTPSIPNMSARSHEIGVDRCVWGDGAIGPIKEAAGRAERVYQPATGLIDAREIQASVWRRNTSRLEGRKRLCQVLGGVAARRAGQAGEAVRSGRQAHTVTI